MICRNQKCVTNTAGVVVRHRSGNPVKCPRCWWPYHIGEEVAAGGVARCPRIGYDGESGDSYMCRLPAGHSGGCEKGERL